jgi:hypothetical protein
VATSTRTDSTIRPAPLGHERHDRQLVVHLAATLLLGTVALVAAWQFMFTGAPTEHKSASPPWTSLTRH